MPQDSLHPEYQKHQKQWERCRDAYEGQDAVKEKGDKYLPRLSKQDETNYTAYKLRALFYGAVERTVQGLVGAAISKPFQYKVPTELKYLIDEANPNQTELDTYTKQIVGDLLTEGRMGILVDMPAVDEPKEGAPAEAEPSYDPDAQPYFVLYTAQQIINWEENDDSQLTRVMLTETYYERDDNDPYKMVVKQRWRELVLEDGKYLQRVHVKAANPSGDAKNSGWQTTEITPTIKGKALTEIPFVIVNANGVETCCRKPPLLAMVDVNFSHYTNSADLEHGRHFTGLPTPWVTGWVAPKDGGESGAPKDLYIGSQTAWVFDDPNVKVGYLEFTGNGLTTLEKALSDKESMMAVLGARLLEQSKAAAETQETVRFRHKGDTFTLGGVNMATADALEIALGYVAKWFEADESAISIVPNKEFGDTTLDFRKLTALVAALQAGGVSKETFLWNLQQGEMLSPDVTIEQEVTRIKAAEADPGLGTILGAPVRLPGGPPAAKPATPPVVPPKGAKP